MLNNSAHTYCSLTAFRLRQKLIRVLKGLILYVYCKFVLLAIFIILLLLRIRGNNQRLIPRKCVFQSLSHSEIRTESARFCSFIYVLTSNLDL
jgi:hypothetical protein